MQSTQNHSALLEMPSELLLNIFQYSSLRDLLTISLVCKKLYQVSGTNPLWSPIFFNQFGYQPEVNGYIRGQVQLIKLKLPQALDYLEGIIEMIRFDERRCLEINTNHTTYEIDKRTFIIFLEALRKSFENKYIKSLAVFNTHLDRYLKKIPRHHIELGIVLKTPSLGVINVNGFNVLDVFDIFQQIFLGTLEREIPQLPSTRSSCFIL